MWLFLTPPAVNFCLNTSLKLYISTTVQHRHMVIIDHQWVVTLKSPKPCKIDGL